MTGNGHNGTLQNFVLTGASSNWIAPGGVATGSSCGTPATCCPDVDGDGFTDAARGGADCDDNDVNNYPGNTEVCNGQDNNCDGVVDEGFDVDGDGVTSCGGDCDDGEANTYPGAPELCDGIDNDCDGTVLFTEADADGDTYRICDGD